MSQWYYASNGAQAGPVGLDVLQGVAASGQLQPADLVWKDGMAEWTPAQNIPELAQYFAPAGDAGGYDVQGGYQQGYQAQMGYANQGYAQQAGTVGYGSQQIGYYTPTQTFVYAGFWWRFLAWFLDALILQGVSLVLGFIVGFIMGAAGLADAAGLAGGLLGMVAAWLYEALQNSSPAMATVGKRVCGITVTDMAGQRITFGRASGRHFGKILSGLILGIGYIMQAFTEKRQALHDQMAGCLVLKKP